MRVTNCLLGDMVAWVVFISNIIAIASLCAGAFSQWLVYSGPFQSSSLYFYAGGLGFGGTSSAGTILGSYTLPNTLVPLTDVSLSLTAGTQVDPAIGWTPNNLNAVYLGMFAQAAAAAAVLASLIFAPLFHFFCTSLCFCCVTPRFTALNIASFNLFLAFVGTLAMGLAMLSLDASLKALSKSPEGRAQAYAVGTQNSNAVLFAILGLNRPPSVGPGEALGALGCALLALVCGMHIVVIRQCGGKEQYPESSLARAAAGV